MLHRAHRREHLIADAQHADTVALQIARQVGAVIVSERRHFDRHAACERLFHEVHAVEEDLGRWRRRAAARELAKATHDRVLTARDPLHRAYYSAFYFCYHD